MVMWLEVYIGDQRDDKWHDCNTGYCTARKNGFWFFMMLAQLESDDIEIPTWYGVSSVEVQFRRQ